MTVGVVDLAHPRVELVVGDGGPVGGLRVRHRLRTHRVVVRVHHALRIIVVKLRKKYFGKYVHLVVHGRLGLRPGLGVAGRVGGGRGLRAQGVGHRGVGGVGRTAGGVGVVGAAIRENIYQLLPKIFGARTLRLGWARPGYVRT